MKMNVNMSEKVSVNWGTFILFYYTNKIYISTSKALPSKPQISFELGESGVVKKNPM